eukprot:TRINITY_DN102819_c0_g1_i1.p1 TRINITY_DN102819_c0_g1~~TRINITY_DN102819_c0_g1_i1.p1  ORF type:complete len:323 (+),score=24.93 TRINITY_DN102819_c0_g1_i1:44-1012(+)
MTLGADSERVSLRKCAQHEMSSKINCGTVEVKADSQVAVLGLVFDALPPGLVVVSEVLADCWAELRGLEAGDVVTAIQGRSVLNLSQDEFVCMIQERPLVLSVRRPNAEADQSTQGDEFPSANALHPSTVASLGQSRPGGAQYGPFHQAFKCKFERPRARLASGLTRPGGASYGPLHQHLECTAGRSHSRVANGNRVPSRVVAGTEIFGFKPSVRFASPSNKLPSPSESMAETTDEDDPGALVILSLNASTSPLLMSPSTSATQAHRSFSELVAQGQGFAYSSGRQLETVAPVCRKSQACDAAAVGCLPCLTEVFKRTMRAS